MTATIPHSPFGHVAPWRARGGVSGTPGGHEGELVKSESPYHLAAPLETARHASSSAAATSCECNYHELMDRRNIQNHEPRNIQSHEQSSHTLPGRMCSLARRMFSLAPLRCWPLVSHCQEGRVVNFGKEPLVARAFIAEADEHSHYVQQGSF
jgi:hypothetical protein